MIEWYGIKVRLEDGTFHYVTDIPSDVAKVIDKLLDKIDSSNLDKEIK